MLTNTGGTVFAETENPRLAVTAYPAAENAVRIELTGELTRESGQLLIRAVRAVLRRGYRDIRVDLSAVQFVDARGLTVCVVAVRMAAEAAATLVFEDATRLVATVLLLGGLGEWMAGSAADRSVAG